MVQVLLVGHSAGGACVSYAMEQFPEKIAKAIFVCATMVSNGQRPFDVFAEEVDFSSITSDRNPSAHHILHVMCS